jgi:hypothetical protein
MIIMYLIIGCVIGFLGRYELEVHSRKKRIKNKLKNISTCNFEKPNESLAVVKELNQKLLLIQQKQSS